MLGRTFLKMLGKMLRSLFASPEIGLLAVVSALMILLTLGAGGHADALTGAWTNNFLNIHTLIQLATDASLFAMMAVGATIVIIAGGIDLSVGSIYALAGTTMALVLRGHEGASVPVLGLLICLGVGALAGTLNGLMVVGLSVHPFIITLGTMWILRGLAFVTSHAESILLPDALTDVVKASLGLEDSLYPVPLLVTVLVAWLGQIYLGRTVMGRHVFAVGGNPEASRYAGLSLGRVRLGVYVISGLTAGLAAYLGAGYYGAASCADANGYELYVVASAVVGGASLQGGKGSAIGAALGALLIILIRQSIRTLHFDQNHEWIIVGVATIVAVVIDQASSRLAARRLAQSPHH